MSQNWKLALNKVVYLTRAKLTQLNNNHDDSRSIERFPVRLGHLFSWSAGQLVTSILLLQENLTGTQFLKAFIHKSTAERINSHSNSFNWPTLGSSKQASFNHVHTNQDTVPLVDFIKRYRSSRGNKWYV